MRKLLIFFFMISFFTKISANENNSLAYDFKFQGIDGNLINLNQYKQTVIVVVNVASRCGYTPQYAALQRIYSKTHSTK